MTASEWVAIGAAAIVVVFALFLLSWPFWAAWERERGRRRNPSGIRPGGAGAGMMGVVDEVFHPNARNAQLIWQAQQELPAPAPDSDKGWDELQRGRIRIELDG